MDRDKLAALRKKQATLKNNKHKELVEASASIKTAIESLHDKLNPAEKFDESKILDQIKSLQDSLTFSEDIKRLEDSLSKLHKEPLKDFDKLLKAVGQLNNKDVVKAINALAVNLDENTVSQEAKDFQPVRRVIKVGDRFIFDDTATPVAMGGGGARGGSSVQSALTRNGGTTLAVTNPDGTPIAGGSGGGVAAYSNSADVVQQGLVDEDRHVQVDVLSAPPVTVDTTGLATDTKQDEQTVVLEEIRDGQQSDGLTDTELRATPVPVTGSLTVDTTGLATEAEQEAQTALLTTIEGNQLPNGHDVTIDNIPSDYPLPASQVTTLTPQTNALTDTQLRANPVPVSGTVTSNLGTLNGAATEAKQDDIVTAIEAIEVAPPVGGSTLAEQEAQTTLLTEIEANQLPDGHNVTVDNQPTEYPLPSAQVTTLTPQTNALTDTQLRAAPVDVDTGLTQPTTPADTQPVSASSLPLPTGAATAANQQTDGLTDAELRATPVEVDTGLVIPTDGLTDAELRATPVPVSGTVAVTGSATSAKQDTIIGHLDGVETLLTDIESDTDTLAVTGGGTETGALRVTLANNSTGVLSVDDNGGSLTVDGTFWQATQPVSAAALPLPSGASTSANQSTIIGHVDGIEAAVDGIETLITSTNTKLDTANTSLGVLDNAISGNEMQVDVVTSALPSGAATAANQLPDGHNVTVDNGSGASAVNIQDGGNSITVDGTFWQATQPVSLASVPSHAVTNAGTFAVQAAQSGTWNIGTVTTLTGITNALPAGTNAIGKMTQPATPTLANVTMTGSSVTLQASNTARRNLMIFNDSGGVVYVKLGSAASSTSFTVKLVDQAYYELPEPTYTGIVTALGASGSVRVTEVV